MRIPTPPIALFPVPVSLTSSWSRAGNRGRRRAALAPDFAAGYTSGTTREGGSDALFARWSGVLAGHGGSNP